MENNISDTMKKLLELSRRGIDGEKANAEKLLKKLMKKYNITEEDLLIEEVKKRDVKYKADWQDKLLNQIMHMINPFRNTYKYRNSKRRVTIIECTDAEFIEFKYLYSIYSNAFERELETFTKAFIYKNNIFPKEEPNKNDQPQQPLDYYDILKTQAMMQGIEITQVRRAIGGKK